MSEQDLVVSLNRRTQNIDPNIVKVPLILENTHLGMRSCSVGFEK